MKLPLKIVLITLVTSAMGMIYYTTSNGYGISPDSMAYLYAAETWVHGMGMRYIHSGIYNEHLTHYPPLYSFLIGSIAVIFGFEDYAEAGNWINICAWGSQIWLLFHILYEETKKVLWAIIPTVFVMTNLVFFETHQMILSEPLYNFFSLLGLWLLYRYFKRNDKRKLIYSSIFIALAFGTRYAGAVLVLTSCLLLFLNQRKNGWGTAFRTSFYYGFVSSSIIIAWLIRNGLVSDKLTGRSIGYHPMDRTYYESALSTLWNFFIQWEDASGHSDGILLIPLIVLLLFGLFRIIQILKFGNSNSFAGILSAYVFAYIAFICVTNTFFDITPLYYRTLGQVFVFTVLAVVIYIYNTVPYGLAKLPVLRWVMIVGIFLYLGKHLLFYYEKLSYKGPRGSYLEWYWTISETMEELKNHPIDAKVFTNSVGAVYLHTRLLTYPFHALGEEANKGGDLVVVLLKNTVYYGGASYDDDYEKDNGISDNLKFKLIKELNDGKIFRVTLVDGH